MSRTLTFDGPDSAQATGVLTDLTRTPTDGLSRELVDTTLSVAAACVDHALASGNTHAHLLPPVVDDHLSVIARIPGQEDTTLTVDIGEVRLDELRGLPEQQVTGLWVQALSALHRLAPYATPAAEMVVLLSTAAAVLRDLNARAVITDGTDAVATDNPDPRLREVRESWRHHDLPEVDRGIVEVLFALAVQTLEAAVDLHGADALVLPYEIAGESLTAGFTTLTDLESTGAVRIDAVTPADPGVPARLQAFTGGDRHIADALWFDVLSAAADHLTGQDTTAGQTLATVLDATGDCLAAGEIVASRGLR